MINLPEHIKQYPPVIQRMWTYVFNSVHEKTQNNIRAIKASNSVLNKNMNKFGASRYGYNAQFNHLIDNFLGRLQSK